MLSLPDFFSHINQHKIKMNPKLKPINHKQPNSSRALATTTLSNRYVLLSLKNRYQTHINQNHRKRKELVLS